PILPTPTAAHPSPAQRRRRPPRIPRAPEQGGHFRFQRRFDLGADRRGNRLPEPLAHRPLLGPPPLPTHRRGLAPPPRTRYPLRHVRPSVDCGFQEPSAYGGAGSLSRLPAPPMSA